jgi:prevent-host-death family protein
VKRQETAMESIGLFEAKTHLSELVARAERGEEFIITRHNKPVAKLVPINAQPTFDVERRKQAVAAMRELGRDIARTHGPISSQDIEQWVRDSRDGRADQVWAAATGRPA